MVLDCEAELLGIGRGVGQVGVDKFGICRAVRRLMFEIEDTAAHFENPLARSARQKPLIGVVGGVEPNRKGCPRRLPATLSALERNRGVPIT